MPDKKIIAVDIDGVLALGEEIGICMSNRKIFNELVVSLFELKEKEHCIIILYTSRNISRKIETIEWLDKNNVTLDEDYDDIVFGKLKYDVLIDNKCINISDISKIKRNKFVSKVEKCLLDFMRHYKKMYKNSIPHKGDDVGIEGVL